MAYLDRERTYDLMDRGCVQRYTLLLGLLFGFLLPVHAYAAKHVIKEVRLWSAPDHSRIVFDLNGKLNYRVFHLTAPQRIVVDVNDTTLHANLKNLSLAGSVLTAFRHGVPKPGVLRFVMDVKEAVQPRSFLLKPMHGKPYRLVVDLMRKQKKRRVTMTTAHARKHKMITIAVDAGHGGEDPGAIGRHGLKEKNVTLAIAKALASAINTRLGMRAVLTRKGDYFVPLRRRVKLARLAKADVMISIHADSVRSRKVSGASVYTLSEKGASDRVAAMLARKENSSDAIGGVRPGEITDPMVNRILADLIKRDSLNSAELLAEEMLKRIRKIGPIKYAIPKHARFMVLTAAEIPSVLVEVDYISNPRRERLLRSTRHRKKLAAALLHASEAFLRSQGRLKKKTATASTQTLASIHDSQHIQ